MKPQANTLGAGLGGLLLAGALSAFQIWSDDRAHQREKVGIGAQIAAVIAAHRDQCDREVALVRELLDE
ncbi:MAG: hypothetical protein V3V08_05385 [Nannocystaceae bacterium]